MARLLYYFNFEELPVRTTTIFGEGDASLLMSFVFGLQGQPINSFMIN